jgi:hypothetical protein
MLKEVLMIMLSISIVILNCPKKWIKVGFGLCGYFEGYPKLKVMLLFKKKCLGRGVGVKVELLSDEQKVFIASYIDIDSLSYSDKSRLYIKCWK